MQDKQHELGDQLWNYIAARKNDLENPHHDSAGSSEDRSSDLAELMMLSDGLLQEFKSDHYASDNQANARKKLVEAIRSERVVSLPPVRNVRKKWRLFPSFQWNRQMVLILILLLLAAFAGGMVTWNAYQNFCSRSQPQQHSAVIQKVSSHCSLSLPIKALGSALPHTVLTVAPIGQSEHCSKSKESELNEGSTTNHSIASRSVDAALTSLEPGSIRPGKSDL